MNKRLRFIILLVILAVAGALLYPTINWYFIVPEDMKAIVNGTRDSIQQYAQTKAQADARELEDLMQTSPDASVPENLKYTETIAAKFAKLLGERPPRQWTVSDVTRLIGSPDEAARQFEDYYRQQILDLKTKKGKIINLGLDLAGGIDVVLEADRASLADRLGKDPTDAEMDEAISLAMEVLNSRIDEFGVSEPVIRRQQGTNRIEIEIPGENDPEVVNGFLQGSGDLKLQIVDDDATNQLLTYTQNFRSQNLRDWNPSTDPIPDFVQAGTAVRAYVEKDEYGIDRVVRYLVTKEDDSNVLDGTYITDANVGYQQNSNKPLTTFRLNNDGAEKFQQLTAANVNKTLAIVLGGQVKAYARISEEIPTGNVSITGFSAEEAGNIATVLKTAALPVKLVIVNMQSVGASLGADAVHAGLNSIFYGLIAVLVFMFLYYKGAGLIADLGLVINLFLMISLLSAFHLTLTLTSIAGLILTVGMAVDANVIIFERIKEEYHQGKTAAASVAAGYKKAFWTIMDANITTFIAALVLSFLGTGPIKGFALTLMVGIFTSVLTALWISRLFFAISTEGLRREKLSITWRKL